MSRVSQEKGNAAKGGEKWLFASWSVVLGRGFAAAALESARLSTYDDTLMLWEENGSSLEIRTQGELADGRPALDEVLAQGASIHLEQMSHDQWWMGIEAGGKYFHLNFSLHNGKLHVHLSDQSDEESEWEGDTMERPFPGTEP
jgi:hypothetical protein